MATCEAPTGNDARDLSTVGLTDLDLWADGPPRQLFARVWAEAPVRRNPSAEGVGVWSLTRDAKISAVSAAPKTYSSWRGGIFRAIKTLSVALTQIVGRLPDMRVAGEVSYVKSTFINFLASLPVGFTSSG